MSKHTPGPWQLEGRWKAGQENLGGWVSTMHPSPIFELVPILGTDESIIADARLIASAPELLMALCGLLAANDAVHLVLCDGPEVPGFDPSALGKAQMAVSAAEEVARAAVAKALAS